MQSFINKNSIHFSGPSQQFQNPALNAEDDSLMGYSAM
jgi:hypothetical protein